MTTTPTPITRAQRPHVTAAAKHQKRVDNLEGQLAEARLARDEEVRWLAYDGVRSFEISNETGIPAGIVRRVVAAEGT